MLTGAGDRSVLKRVISKEIPMRWEDAMLSGNGSTGIMVKGVPLDDCIIVNHEKFWTIGNDFRPETPDMKEAWVVANFCKVFKFLNLAIALSRRRNG